MTSINFEKMELSEDEKSVIITGECSGREVTIELSILQLAKVFGADKGLAEEVEREFGSEELEGKCEETKNLVYGFPHISVWNTSIELTVTGEEVDGKNVIIMAEDLGGWDNQGVRIYLPIDLHSSTLKEKIYTAFISPFEITFEFVNN